MLDDSTKAQLASYFERITQPVELIASLDGSAGAADIRELVTEIAAIGTGQDHCPLRRQLRAQAFVPDHPRRPGYGRALRRLADGP